MHKPTTVRSMIKMLPLLQVKDALNANHHTGLTAQPMHAIQLQLLIVQ